MLTMLSIPGFILERTVRVSKRIRGGKEELKRTVEIGGGVKMAQKVTISVPDKLFKEMQKWRKVLNFSMIFQEAV